MSPIRILPSSAWVSIVEGSNRRTDNLAVAVVYAVHVMAVTFVH